MARTAKQMAALKKAQLASAKKRLRAKPVGHVAIPSKLMHGASFMPARGQSRATIPRPSKEDQAAIRAINKAKKKVEADHYDKGIRNYGPGGVTSKALREIQKRSPGWRKSGTNLSKHSLYKYHSGK